jgi:hypothetical protein
MLLFEILMFPWAASRRAFWAEWYRCHRIVAAPSRHAPSESSLTAARVDELTIAPIITRQSNRMKTAILTVAVILLVAALALYVDATSPQKELNRFLNQVATVEVGKTELADWRTRLERAHLSNWSMACDQQTTTWGGAAKTNCCTN